MEQQIQEHQSLNPGRKLLLITILGLLVALASELGARAIFAFWAGSSAILYGTPWHRNNVQLQTAPAHTVRQHEHQLLGYTKYFPNESKQDHDPDTGEEFLVTINRHGFRGAEFDITKEANTLRIVTLGASSTFGYYDRDNETYAYYLERYLKSRTTAVHFEVINLGIPHLTTTEILSLFRAEALPLKPDIVTFYEGANDSAEVAPQTAAEKDAEVLQQSWREKFASVSVLRAVYRGARDHSILLAFADSFLKSEALWVVTEADYSEHTEGKTALFLANIAELHELCRDRGILFIPMKQQLKSMLIDDVTGVSYEEEFDRVRQLMNDGQPIGFYGLVFLTHKLLMDALDDWARENDVPLVDVIDLLNERRDLIWPRSWVHLRPQANEMIAAALADKITESFPEY